MEPARRHEPSAIEVPPKPAPKRTAEHDRALDAYFAEMFPEGFSDEELEAVDREWQANHPGGSAVR